MKAHQHLSHPWAKPVVFQPPSESYVPKDGTAYRPGALDYRQHPSRVGNERIPYKAATGITSDTPKTYLGTEK